MGMFDTFFTNTEFECPSCEKKVNIEHGVQSKKFESTLDGFSAGDVPLELNEHTTVVEEYDWCPHCGKTIPIFLAFHRGIYVEAFTTKEIAEQNSKTFDILSHYKQIHREKTIAVHNFNSIVYDLTTVHELYSQKPSQQRLTSFMFLRQTDVLDFNIMTTIQNIIDKFKGT